MPLISKYASSALIKLHDIHKEQSKILGQLLMQTFDTNIISLNNLLFCLNVSFILIPDILNGIQ